MMRDKKRNRVKRRRRNCLLLRIRN
jgi:hypothetical protein